MRVRRTLSYFWMFLLPRLERVLGLSVGEDFVILACIVLRQYQHVRDGRMDNSTIANIGLCLASYSDALQRQTVVGIAAIAFYSQVAKFFESCRKTQVCVCTCVSACVAL